MWGALADMLNVTTRDCLAHDGTITLTPPSGPAESIEALFDEHYTTVGADRDGYPIETTRPMLDVRLADLSATPTHAWSVSVDGQAYEISEVAPDGNGGAKLYLREVPS